MRHTTTVFQHMTETYTTATGKVIPMTLLVKTYPMQDGGLSVEIKGEKNPLPFKSAVIQPAVNLDAWIESKGYKKIGEF